MARGFQTQGPVKLASRAMRIQQGSMVGKPPPVFSGQKFQGFLQFRLAGCVINRFGYQHTQPYSGTGIGLNVHSR